MIPAIRGICRNERKQIRATGGKWLKNEEKLRMICVSVGISVDLTEGSDAAGCVFVRTKTGPDRLRHSRSGAT